MEEGRESARPYRLLVSTVCSVVDVGIRHLGFCMATCEWESYMSVISSVMDDRNPVLRRLIYSQGYVHLYVI